MRIILIIHCTAGIDSVYVDVPTEEVTGNPEMDSILKINSGLI